MTVHQATILPPLSRRTMDEAHRMLLYLCEHAQRERDMQSGNATVRPEPPISVSDALQRLRDLLSLNRDLADAHVVWEARAALLTRYPARPESYSNR